MSNKLIEDENRLPEVREVPLVVPVENFAEQKRADFQNLVEIASIMKKFIIDNKLTVNIQGNEFVKAEGWSMLTAFMGYKPVIKYVKDVSVEGEIAFECEAELVDQHGVTQSGGIAFISNKEPKHGTQTKSSLQSKVQTRAISKACRNRFGFIIKLSGFEATPADEMESMVQEEPVSNGDRIIEICRNMHKATSFEDVNAEWLKLSKQQVDSNPWLRDFGFIIGKSRKFDKKIPELIRPEFVTDQNK